MSEQDSFDLVIIGAGPGGYVAALRAAQLGLRTACIDKGPALGGTCLNIGCIPSKALLNSSELYTRASKEFKAHGIGIGELSLDLATMMKRKDRVVTTLTRGIAGLLKKAGVESVTGAARLAGEGSVEVGTGVVVGAGSVGDSSVVTSAVVVVGTVVVVVNVVVVGVVVVDVVVVDVVVVVASGGAVVGDVVVVDAVVVVVVVDETVSASGFAAVDGSLGPGRDSTSIRDPPGNTCKSTSSTAALAT